MSDKSLVQSSTRLYRSFSIDHTSFLAPLPNDGGSIKIMSYLLPLLSSLLTNFLTSSTKNLMVSFSKWLDLTFSLAQSIIPLDESTCTTSAPSFRAAILAAPV